MIRLKISRELFTDLFTPGMVIAHECIRGLPVGIELTSIEFDSVHKIITCLFDDGKPEIEDAKIIFENRVSLA